MRALRTTIKACRPSGRSAIGREQETNAQGALAGMPVGPRHFSVLPSERPDPELSAWGFAFIGLGYLAIIEGMYLAYKRYSAEAGKMQYGLARDDALWHQPTKPSTNAASVDLEHVPPSEPTIGDAKERLLRIHEVIQGKADKTGSHTAFALFLDEKSSPEMLRKLIDGINEELHSCGKPELSLTALTGEAAHKMKEIVQKFEEALKEGAMRQGPLEDAERMYFIDPELDLVIEYV